MPLPSKQMNSQEYIEVTISIEPFSEEAAEIVEAEIAELPYDSFVVEDGCLKAYIQKEDYDARMLRMLLSGMDLKTSFTAAYIQPENWNADWEGNFEPIVVEGVITVKPSRCKNVPRTRFNISLSPDMAFGTGHHQTTYMMMSAMLEHEDEIRGCVVFDIGCGTGVLTILAGKMRAKHVHAADLDMVAARSAFFNTRRNLVGPRVDIRCGDASLMQLSTYNVILANIHRNVILMDLRTYARSLKAGGLLFTSGFYDSDVPDICKEAENQGLVLISILSRDGWSCLVFRK